jgi:hypothetical protein
MASHFVPIQLLESGRPILLANEVELVLQSSVEVLEGSGVETRMRNGVARLTTYRLIWSNLDRASDSVALSLQLIESIDMVGINSSNNNSSSNNNGGRLIDQS